MATKKVQFKIYLDPNVKADMDLLYEGICNAVSTDASRHWHVDVSKSKYWESVISEHLNSQNDLLRIFKMKKAGTFGIETE